MLRFMRTKRGRGYAAEALGGLLRVVIAPQRSREGGWGVTFYGAVARPMPHVLESLEEAREYAATAFASLFDDEVPG